MNKVHRSLYEMFKVAELRWYITGTKALVCHNDIYQDIGGRQYMSVPTFSNGYTRLDIKECTPAVLVCDGRMILC